jgi:hypothetical protein
MTVDEYIIKTSNANKFIDNKPKPIKAKKVKKPRTRARLFIHCGVVKTE